MAYKRKTDQPKKDHYSDTAKEIADIFIKALEEETLPWHSGFDKFRYIKPFNPANGTVYQGMNSFNFALKSYIRGYRDPRFMTMSQANELGGKVKKGEHCIWGFNFKPTQVLVKDDEGNPILDDKGQKQYREMIFPKPFMVFNVEQFEGLNLPKIPEIEQPDHKWTPVERAENLLKASKANISNELTCLVPHYSPLADKITLPLPNQYHDAENYYSTALHELSHWTGHSSRLNRDFAKDKHTQKYAREELRAEIGSAMVNMMLGIAPKISENNKAYIKGWIAHLKEEPKEILRACGDAEKISDYIMNFDPEYVKTKEACQNQKLLTDSEPITQQNLETAVADAKTLTSQRENDDVVKQLSAIVEEAEKDYREIYNKGKERGYYQDVDFDTFEEIYTRTALSAIPKEDSQTREDHEEWSVERLVDATDLFANFDKAEQTPNNNINQTATDKTPVAPLLDDEVKVVGFNNDSDLTVLNSPTQSHKSPDIER